MTKKNLLPLVLASALVLTLAACGGKDAKRQRERSGAESSSDSGAQTEQSQAAELTGGSDRDSAQGILLDTRQKERPPGRRPSGTHLPRTQPRMPHTRSRRSIRHRVQ